MRASTTSTYLLSMIRVDTNMRPEPVTKWRENLPPPFDKEPPPIHRRFSFSDDGVLAGPSARKEYAPAAEFPRPPLRHRKSTEGALEKSDRLLVWTQSERRSHEGVQAQRVETALWKLRTFVCPSLCAHRRRLLRFDRVS